LEAAHGPYVGPGALLGVAVIAGQRDVVRGVLAAQSSRNNAIYRPRPLTFLAAILAAQRERAAYPRIHVFRPELAEADMFPLALQIPELFVLPRKNAKAWTAVLASAATVTTVFARPCGRYCGVPVDRSPRYGIHVSPTLLVVTDPELGGP
jgi:hypothetical protein